MERSLWRWCDSKLWNNKNPWRDLKIFERITYRRVFTVRADTRFEKNATMEGKDAKKNATGKKSMQKLSHLFHPSGGVPSGRLIPGYCCGKCPLLYPDVGAALDGKKDEATEQSISDEKGAYTEVYNKTLQEGVLASLVRHAAEAQAPNLSRRMRFRAIRGGPLQGRRIPIVRGLEALVSPVMSRVLFLHSISLFFSFFFLPSLDHSNSAFAIRQRPSMGRAREIGRSTTVSPVFFPAPSDLQSPATIFIPQEWCGRRARYRSFQRSVTVREISVSSTMIANNLLDDLLRDRLRDLCESVDRVAELRLLETRTDLEHSIGRWNDLRSKVKLPLSQTRAFDYPFGKCCWPDARGSSKYVRGSFEHSIAIGVIFPKGRTRVHWNSREEIDALFSRILIRSLKIHEFFEDISLRNKLTRYL